MNQEQAHRNKHYIDKYSHAVRQAETEADKAYYTYMLEQEKNYDKI